MKGGYTILTDFIFGEEQKPVAAKLYDTKGNKILDLDVIDCSLTMETDDSRYGYSRGNLALAQYPRNRTFTFTCTSSIFNVYMNNGYKYDDEKEFVTMYDSGM